MKMIVRMTRGFFSRVRDDLERPHAVAAERIGFVFGRWALAREHVILYPTEYLAVRDDDYIDAPFVGAKINSAAIRAALQGTLDRKASCLHVHLHSPHIPCFSGLDRREQDRLIPSFRAVNRDAPHGAMVLWGEGGGVARIWAPGAAGPGEASRVSVVGYPMTLSGGGT